MPNDSKGADKSHIEAKNLEDYINKLISQLSDPTHKELIKAYQGTDPLHSMEAKLGKLLLEILHSED